MIHTRYVCVKARWSTTVAANTTCQDFSFLHFTRLASFFAFLLSLFQFGVRKIAFPSSLLALSVCLGQEREDVEAYFSGQWISRSQSLERSLFCSHSFHGKSYWGCMKRLTKKLYLSSEENVFWPSNKSVRWMCMPIRCDAMRSSDVRAILTNANDSND